MSDFEPKIIALVCNWCTYTAADLAGTSRLAYPANIRMIRMMCTGMIDQKYVIKAFIDGADGVFVGGCHPGDCHYIKGNYYARRRIALVRDMLDFVGLEPERFQMSWVSAAEGTKYTEIITDFVDALKPLGPQAKLRRRQ
jgi:F420-non-reducing hydrogenase iron-sulfur subunit